MESKIILTLKNFANTRSNFKDAISGFFIIVFGTLMFSSSFSIKAVFGGQTTSSAFFPKLIGVLLAFTGLILFIGGIRKCKLKEDKEAIENPADIQNGSKSSDCEIASVESESVEERKEIKNKTWMTILALLFYTVMLKPLGFIITSVFFVTVQATILTKKENRKKRILIWFIVALMMTVGVYYLFRYVLNLFLPVGILG